MKEFKQGEIIFRQGDPGDSMYDIFSGRVGVYAAYGTANEKLLTELKANEFFGEMGLLEKAPRSATVVALEDTAVYVIGEDDFNDYFIKQPEKALQIMRQLSQRLRRRTEDYLEACQPSFKVGFFGRGKKTEAELERRKQVFFEDASEKAKTQIEWHLKTFLLEFVRQHNVNDKELQDKIQSMEILPPEELLTEAMRSGAKLTQDGSYVMNYTLNFAEGIKNVARSKAGEIKNTLLFFLTHPLN